VVGVLELVYEDEAVALLAAPEHVRARAQQAQHLHDLVPEVDLPEARHEDLVLAVGAGQLQMLLGLEARRLVAGGGQQRLGVGEVLVRPNVLVLEAAEQRDHGLDVSSGITEGPVVLEGELEKVIAHEDDLLRAREYPEVWSEPELEGVLLDEAIAEGVEGRDLHVRIAVGDELVDPFFHLRRRLVREGEGEHLGRTRAARGDEVSDAPSDDGGLARPCPRDDQEGTRLVSDGLPLGSGQPVENCRSAAGSFGHQNLMAKWTMSAMKLFVSSSSVGSPNASRP